MNKNDTPQQLTLLPSSDLPIQFRLDSDTRRRGLQHIAEIRLYLADRNAAKDTITESGRASVRQPVRPAA